MSSCPGYFWLLRKDVGCEQIRLSFVLSELPAREVQESIIPGSKMELEVWEARILMVWTPNFCQINLHYFLTWSLCDITKGPILKLSRCFRILCSPIWQQRRTKEATSSNLWLWIAYLYTWLRTKWAKSNICAELMLFVIIQSKTLRRYIIQNLLSASKLATKLEINELESCSCLAGRSSKRLVKNTIWDKPQPWLIYLLYQRN